VIFRSQNKSKTQQEEEEDEARAPATEVKPSTPYHSSVSLGT
jgi:hypothetical protein